jgi:1,4-dihydroxy-2-naphthoyl-CoA hydrolase
VDLEMLTGGLNDTLGFRFEVVGPDRVELRWTIGPQHLQPYGIVHGGVYSAAVETAASIGAAMWLGERGQVVGVANNTDFLRATRSGELTATATPLHRGRSQQLWLVEVARADGKLAARGQVRLQNLPAEGGLPPA